MRRFGQGTIVVMLVVGLLVCALLVEPHLLGVDGADAVIGLVLGGGLAGLVTGIARRRATQVSAK